MQQLPDGLPLPRRYWSVTAISLAVFMAVMDSAIANVALPTIARDLNTDAAYSIWIVNGYQIAIAISLLPLASFGEIVGYRRIYMGGLMLFTLASLFCATSQSFLMLAGARVLQGFGAAGVMSVNAALIRYTWPHHQLGRGIGISALVVAIAAAAGPTIAAGVLSVADWPWLFAVNVPFGLAALGIGRLALPDSPLGKNRFDFSGALLTAIVLGLLIASVDALGHKEKGWLIIGQILVAITLGAALVQRQLSLPSPLLPVDLLRQPIIALSVATSISAFLAQMSALVSLPFFLQTKMGFSAVETGLLMTPWPIASGFAAPVAGYLSDRYPAGVLGTIGLLLLASGLAALALLSTQPTVGDMVWRMALCGLGFGFFQSPNNRSIVSNAPRERAGGAAGMLGMARLLGQTTGAALVAMLFGRVSNRPEVAALFLAAGFSVIGAGISSLRLLDMPNTAAPPNRMTEGREET